MTTTTDGIALDPNAALVVIDVQQGFEDSAYWGPRNNPGAEDNITALLDAWQRTGRPVVLVRHDSVHPDSPLAAGTPGNAFRDFVEKRRADTALLVTKTVNSAFYGTPDLQEWLTAAGIGQLVPVGIQTNMCVETTARMAGNLGHRVLLPLDATHTFDLAGPAGLHLTADELATATAVSLHGGGFAQVVTTAQLLAATAE
ncbi:cysteine hydrolase family protein [Streptomyces sp. NPDC048603]|uniref:cysteine hydrolase family protein n=1 Tax=Streptomyces sp. NPDC048603 TaxID=3365577 RepID=UPI00371B140B